MIVWRGKGLLVVLAFGISAVLSNVFFQLFGLELANHFDSDILLLMLGVFAAVFNYLFSKFFISTEERIYIDEATGERVVYRDRSSFMFIPNRFWTWIFLIVALVLVIMPYIV